MEQLNFLILIQEEVFETKESRRIAGFSEKTDPEEYFQVFAEVGIEDNNLLLNKLKLYSIERNEYGMKTGLRDISELITEDLKQSIKIYIIENEL